MIRVCIEVPSQYRPKAEYALRNLLMMLRLRMQLVAIDDLKEPGIYYGNAPNREPGAGILRIPVSDSAIRFFNGDTADIPRDGIRYFRSPAGEKIPVIFAGGTLDADSTGAYDDQAPEALAYDGAGLPDLIAPAFFFLSDWQGGMDIPKDQHGRFRYEQSLQKELGITDIPVVNEYAVFLGKCLEKTGIALNSKTWCGNDFALALTHDIDRIQKKTKGTWFRESVDFLLLNKNSKTFPERLDRWQTSVIDLVTPGDSYEDSILKLIGYSKTNGIRPTLFVQSNSERHQRDTRDYLNAPFFGKLTDLIAEAGGEIGYHPGYGAGHRGDLFRSGLEKLEERISCKVQSVRFHYLRYDENRMPGILSDCSIANDSTMAWADHTGFRTGSVTPHTLFDRNKNRDSGVLEIPMMAMDVQLVNYMGLNISDSVDLLRKQVDLAVRYNGVVVWNYHHHTFDPIEAPGWSRLFGQSLTYALEKEPYNDTIKGIAEKWSAV